MSALLLFWYQAACGCQWYDDDRGWRPCPVHLHQQHARWC